MEEKNYNISTENFGKATEEATWIAVEVVKEEKKLNIILDKALNICQRLTGIPIIGAFVEDIMVMVDMIQSYIHKEYTQIPFASIISCLAALIYLVIPFDIIPDCTPIVGYMDDIGVVKFVLQALQMDLEQYKQWKISKVYQKIMRSHEMR